MSNDTEAGHSKLPELPEPSPETYPFYGANQMYAYARRAIAERVPDGFVVVPREFVQRIRDLAHNYPMAEAPFQYYGTERDTFCEAYRRCGNDLKAALALLAAAPRPSESSGENGNG